LKVYQYLMDNDTSLHDAGAGPGRSHKRGYEHKTADN